MIAIPIEHALLVAAILWRSLQAAPGGRSLTGKSCFCSCSLPRRQKSPWV